MTWHQGALYVRCGGDGILLDAPPGIEQRLGAERLGRLRAVIVTSGRTQSIGGLIGLLGALEAHRGEAPLDLHTPAGEERSALLADAWVRGWPDRFPVTVDTHMPGHAYDIGPFRVDSTPVRHAEPRWTRPAKVERGVGVAVVVGARGVDVAWIPGAGPSPVIRRLTERCDLAVLEVGVTSWPSSDEPWRLSVSTAMAAASRANGEIWLVGDDGTVRSGATA